MRGRGRCSFGGLGSRGCQPAPAARGGVLAHIEKQAVRDITWHSVGKELGAFKGVPARCRRSACQLRQDVRPRRNSHPGRSRGGQDGGGALLVGTGGGDMELTVQRNQPSSFARLWQAGLGTSSQALVVPELTIVQHRLQICQPPRSLRSRRGVRCSAAIGRVSSRAWCPQMATQGGCG